MKKILISLMLTSCVAHACGPNFFTPDETANPEPQPSSSSIHPAHLAHLLHRINQLENLLEEQKSTGKKQIHVAIAFALINNDQKEIVYN